jgi:small subunit ribosomal protein S20
MPNSPSAKKALRKSLKRRELNRAQRSALRTWIKKARTAATGEDRAAADEALRLAAKKLDQAAAKKLIHKNKAARLKSRLSALMKKKSQATSGPATGAPSAT